ncbi:hypothetical protein ACFXGA_25170 [Actinosynnema sp. NPDC059335]|uniref:TRAFAC clade GTPase domain-containing protein n=1 Tax=Actinosynnema sp. NPDC059335 TaxID=3346804 RepID=UPI00367272DF
MNPEPEARWVRCPVCLERFAWREDELWLPTGEVGGYERLDLEKVNDPLKRRDIRRNSYQRCPNPSQDTEPHHLPASYLDYKPPLVIGIVGRTESGKTHLLTSIIAELLRGGLQPHGLTAQAMDYMQHRRFQVEQLDQLAQGKELPGTRHGLTGFAAVLLVSSPAGTWPVTFFDIAGEDFLSVGDTGKAGRFLIGASAVMFVETPEDALGVSRENAERQAESNATFARVLARLKDLPHAAELPVCVVLNKSDRLRYVPPVDKWIRRQDDGELDAAALLEESRDFYGFLSQHRADSSLTPFHEFPLCTLHFVSATGSESIGKRFVRGVRAMRVLRPLVALLAMSGVLDGPEARKVGRWYDSV